MSRTALVTGGASGLGAAAAARLRAEGLAVTTLDVSGPADVIADVIDEAALRRTSAEIGPVDVLINSAGIIGPNKPLVETAAEEWRRVFGAGGADTYTQRAIPGSDLFRNSQVSSATWLTCVKPGRGACGTVQEWP